MSHTYILVAAYNPHDCSSPMPAKVQDPPQGVPPVPLVLKFGKKLPDGKGQVKSTPGVKRTTGSGKRCAGCK